MSARRRRWSELLRGRELPAAQRVVTPPSASTPEQKPATGDAGGPLAAAEAQRLRFVGALDTIRDRADRTAKVFGTLATTALTAVGLSEIADIFPVPPGGWPWVGLAIGGFVALAASVLLFTRRLWRAGAPIFTVSSLTTMADELEGGRGGREYALVEKVYDDAVRTRSEACGNPSTYSLWRYERYGVGLQRKADGRGPSSHVARERAAVIRAEVAAAQARATALIARDRATRVVSSWATAWIVVGFLAGLIAFGAATDWLAYERDDTAIALAKSCGEAQKAITDGKGVGGTALPAVCGSSPQPVASTPPTPQPVREQSATIAALATQWRDCVTTASQPAQVAACDATRLLIVQVAGTPS